MKKHVLTAVILTIAMFSVGGTGVCAASGSELLDNPDLRQQSFQEIYQNGDLSWEKSVDMDSVSVDDTLESGILISGRNEELADTRFTFAEELDFGSSGIQRIMVKGLGEEGKKIRMNIYLDGEEEPTAVITLPNKTGTDWKAEKNVNAVLEGGNITGTHKVEFSVCQYYNDGPREKGSSSVYLDEIQFVAASIPILNIKIDESLGTIEAMNADVNHETMCYGEVSIVVPDDYEDEYQSSYKGDTYEMEYIRGRGNSSWLDAKQKLPYKIKLDSKEDLFGMGENKHWALLANERDISQVRNSVVYELGEECGLEFTPQEVAVDVVMNGEYLGNYFLCENIRVDENRVEIDDLSEDDSNISGGYLLGTGAWGADEEEYIFTTKHDVEFNVTSPSSVDAAEFAEENAYIEAYMQRIEDAIYGEPNPETGEIENPFDLMDLDSAVKYYWIQELSENNDFFGTSSTYCYKKRDDKLYWGPLWDFDVTWQTIDLAEIGIEPETDWRRRYKWFEELLMNEEFLEAATAYYRDTLLPILEDMLSDGGFYDRYTDRIEYAAVNTHALLGYKLQEEDENGNNITNDPVVIREEYEKALAVLKSVIRDKAEWCMENIDTLKTRKIELVFRADEVVVDSKEAFLGDLVSYFPDVPVSEDENLVFDGWFYTVIGEDGSEEETKYEKLTTISKNACITEGDSEQIIIDAKFVTPDPAATITGICLEQDTYNIPISLSTRMNMNVVPGFKAPVDGDMSKVSWKSSDENIVVAGSYFYGPSLMSAGEGTATVTGTLPDGSTVSFEVHVIKVPEDVDLNSYRAEEFELSESSVEMKCGETTQVKISKITPADSLNTVEMGEDGEYTWSVVSGTACDVDHGMITAKEAGTATIMCQNRFNGKVQFVTVQVN